ncbi:MAG: hypothetical protein WCG93_14705 [Paludibacter sp.]
MKELTHLGIWMDHSYAYLMETKANVIVTNCIVSETMLQDHERSLNEGHKHVDFNDTFKREKQERANYYSKISEVIRNYKEVIIFGPTDAKSELLNLLEADHLFSKIKIEKKDADKMTENEMHALVIAYFKEKHLA